MTNTNIASSAQTQTNDTPPSVVERLTNTAKDLTNNAAEFFTAQEQNQSKQEPTLDPKPTDDRPFMEKVQDGIEHYETQASEAVEDVKSKAVDKVADNLRVSADLVKEHADKMSPPQEEEKEEKGTLGQVADTVSRATAATVNAVKSLWGDREEEIAEPEPADDRPFMEKVQDGIEHYETKASEAVQDLKSKAVDKVADNLRVSADLVKERADKMSPPQEEEKEEEKGTLGQVADTVSGAATATVGALSGATKATVTSVKSFFADTESAEEDATGKTERNHSN